MIYEINQQLPAISHDFSALEMGPLSQNFINLFFITFLINNVALWHYNLDTIFYEKKVTRKVSYKVL